MKNKYKTLSALLESFFINRLMNEMQASQHTIESYRDTFRMLLEFSKEKLQKQPSKLELKDLNATFINDFLNDLEDKRGITPRSRNQRLSAIRSFYKYIAFKVPEYSLLINRVLSIPNKRHGNNLVTYLQEAEMKELLKAPDINTWIGRRDHALLATAIQTGLRVSELTAIKTNDLHLGTGAYVRCNGKGRKERCTPLSRQTAKLLKSWIKENNSNLLFLFPNIHGKRLSSDSVQYLISKYAKIAEIRCASLMKKKVSPHVLRHTTAMELLQAGVDRSVIALWLGHEQVETTQIYLEADLKMKEKILKRIVPAKIQTGRFQAGDKLLSFLKEL